MFFKLFNKIKSSDFIRNLFIVMSGTAVAQAIGFAMSPIISRLFTPSDFGIFGSFNAILMVISAGVTLDYAQAIMLPKEKEDAINIFILSCLSVTIITGIALSACILAPKFIQNLMEAPNPWIIILLVLAIMISGINKALQAWSVRVKAFNDTSVSQVIRSLSSNFSQISFGYLSMGSTGLIIANILGNFLASVNLFLVFLHDFVFLRNFIKLSRILQLAKEYRNFPLFSSPREIMNALSRNLPVLILTHFYGIAVAGAYAFGIRILSVPMGFVLGALRQVLFQKASESYNYDGRLLLLYVKTTGGLIILSFFPAIVLFVWAPEIFKLIFGPQWYTAGEFARWLVLWLTVMFCNLPSSIFSQILMMQRQAFIFDIFLLLIRASVLIVGGMNLSALNNILLFSLTGGFMNLLWIFIVGYVLIRKEGYENLKIWLSIKLK